MSRLITSVELMGRYSNFMSQTEHYRAIIATPAGPPRPPSNTRQHQTRLDIEQIDLLLHEYGLGAKVNDLAIQFGVSRYTVLNHVRKSGTPTHHLKMSKDEIRIAKLLYTDGDSLATIGERLGVAPNTVRLALQKEGISTRPRPGK